jgi:serine/threonine protein phosphatase PrpC
MARSIGDHAVKAVGVTAEPEVRMRKILPGDRFIVIASDGVSHM